MNHVFPNVNVEHMLDPQTAVPKKTNYFGHVFLC